MDLASPRPAPVVRRPAAPAGVARIRALVPSVADAARRHDIDPLLLMALVPGFPAPVFVALGLVSLVAGVLLTPVLRQRLRTWSRPAWAGVPPARSAPPAVISTAAPTPRPAVPLLLELPPDWLADQAAPRLREALERMLEHFQLQLGLPLPRVVVHGAGPGDAAAQWRLLAYEVPLVHGEAPQGDMAQALADAVRQAIRRHAAMFVGIQETSSLLARASADVPDVVKEVLRALPVQRVAEVMRRLVAEEVSIRNMRDILEALAEAAQREKDVHALTELARIALRRAINHRVAPDGVLRALMLAPALEDTLRQAVRVSGGVAQMALEPDLARRLADDLFAHVRRLAPAAIVCAIDIRWHLRKLIEPECFDTPVLSLHELMPATRLVVLEQVLPPDTALLEAA